MKKSHSRTDQNDDVLPEYDFSKLKGAVRGKYYKRYRAGKNIVRFTMVAVPAELVPEVQALIARGHKTR